MASSYGSEISKIIYELSDEYDSAFESFCKDACGSKDALASSSTSQKILIHNDLHADNILVKENSSKNNNSDQANTKIQISAIVDFNDAIYAEPIFELGILISCMVSFIVKKRNIINGQEILNLYMLVSQSIGWSWIDVR